MTTHDSCLPLFSFRAREVVSLVGAGGKSSLMFCLARELKEAGKRVLMTTTTKMFHPEPDQYDTLDLGERPFARGGIDRPGRYFAAAPSAPATTPAKVASMAPGCLERLYPRFDASLIEADGAAMKPLKGWKESEPVVPDFTTLTIGVVDISTVGRVVDDSLVHRLELFTRLTGARAGEPVTLAHLVRVIEHPDGLFRKGRGRCMVYANKVETERDRENLAALKAAVLPPVKGGSLHRGLFFS